MSDQLAAAAAELETVYRRIESTAMANVPVLNRALAVQAVGMTRTEAGLACVLVTPWFINLVLLPEALAPSVQPGTKSRVALPGGVFEFIQSHHDELGPHRMCSLMSPVFEFEAQADAVAMAEAVLGEILAPQANADLEDADMLAVWEGRLPQINDKPDAASEAGSVPETGKKQKHVSRRAIFGLRPTEEAAT